MTLIVPNPGDKVQVREKQLLEELFGDEVPEGPGTVSRVDGPGEHQLELANGLAVQVSWDRLNKDGSVPKTKEVDLWAFDISEIKVL